MYRSSFKRAIVAAVVLIILSPLFNGYGKVFALDPKREITQYNHDIFQSKDGLPQNSIQSIIQTRDGYLWFGTQEGLARFDGVQFRLFDKRNTEEIKNNHIQALFESRDGSLWIGTNDGLNRYRDGKFNAYGTGNGLSNSIGKAIYEDRDGNLWIGTNDGLNRYRDGKFNVYKTEDGLPNNFIFSIYESADKSLWIGTNGGLCRFKDGAFTTYGTREGLSNLFIRAIFESRDGSLWVGTYGGGLNRLKDGRFTTYSTKDGLSNDFVKSIIEDRDGNLWIGTYGGGLNRYNNGRFTSYRTEDGSLSDFIYTIFEDREGSLWVGSENGGLDRFKDGKIFRFTTKNGLSSDIALAIYEAKDGSLWIGTNGGGLNRFKDGKFTAYRAKDGLPNERVMSIWEARDGNLWIGTQGGGLTRFKDGKFSTYTTRDGLSNNFVKTIIEDRDGQIWIGTESGLNRFKDGLFKVYRKEEGLPDNFIWSIEESRDGLWIGTNDGLSLLKDEKFTTYSTNNGLARGFVVALHEDDQGSLWIGTYGGGLSRFKDGKFTNYTVKEGLYDDVVFQILEDKSSNLWMSCGKGIFQISKRELTDFAEGKIRSINYIAYDQSDGLDNGGCNGGFQPAGWRSRDGRLWFPTFKGIALIDPDKIKKNNTPPPVLLEQVIFDKEPFSPKERLSFSPGKEKLEIHFTCLSFLDPKEVKFKFKLEGYDKEWVEAGTLRTAYYTHIPPGNYRFRVIACNESGVWNETGASFDFYLAPYFYQTYLFYTLCTLAVLLIGAVIYTLRVRHMKVMERELRRLVDERTNELQEEIEERKRADMRLKAIIEACPLAVITLDLNGRVISWNPAAERIFGWSEQEVLGKPSPHVPEDKQEEFKMLSDFVLKGKGFTNVEVKRRQKFGKPIDVSISTAPLTDSDGNVSGMVGVIADITERKLAEEALRFSQFSIDRAADAIFWVRPDGGFSYVNDKACQSLGYKREELLSLKVFDIDPSASEEKWPIIWEESKERGSFTIESSHRTRDGKLFPIELTINHLEFNGKDYSCCFVRDISERNRAEEALRASEKRFRRLVENATDAFFLTDLKGKIVDVNQRACDSLGYTREELLRLSVPDIEKDYQGEKLQKLRQLITTTSPVTVEGIHQRKDGATFPVEVHIGHFEAGEQQYILALARDITERKRAEAQVRTSLREKEVLLKEIHHRVKNNLQIISSLLNLQAGYIRDRQALEMFKESQDRVRSMALIHEKLYQSKDLGRIDFAEYIRTLAANLFRSYRVNSDAIVLSIDVADVFLSVDTAIPCGLIINELVSNSLKYAFPKGGAGNINIKLNLEGNDNFTLVVSDDGVGFPKELDFRETESLGLQLVTTLTEQLGGKIELNNGKGTEFRINFTAFHHKDSKKRLKVPDAN